MTKQTIQINNSEIDLFNINRVGCIIKWKVNNNWSYLLNKSSGNFISDFGGGIKKKEFWKDGFYRELSEECDWMKDFIIHFIETNNFSSFLFQKINSKNTIHYSQLLIIIDISNTILLDYTIFKESLFNYQIKVPIILKHFYPTKEIKELLILSTNQLINLFNGYGLNTGLNQLKKIHKKNLLIL